ncbi:MAG: serine--tRNA ligase [Candidatus Omnitrophica bacterium]|nr:serine--tRNA ligase [Candidatus Omnitrophota bacterium]MDD5080571.1 serine--tRNA ligase [Candidatus Omnitrophota bacterium]MDD5441078.1 serine--tRNA ligase [Candidatus Omnitrophota bacterium]
MLDIKILRNNPEIVKESLIKRNDKFDLDAFLALDNIWRNKLSELETLSARQNILAQETQLLIKDKKDPKSKIEESKQLKSQLAELEKDFAQLDIDYKAKLDWLPNIVHSSVPVGDESKNELVSQYGEKPDFKFKAKDHVTLAEELNMVDFKAGTKLTGTNFVTYTGDGATLERALINFMLDLHIKEHGYREVSVPFLVNSKTMRATGQLPKLKDDMYNMSDDDFYLIPTAEVPVTNLKRDVLLDESELPIYNVCATPCFRREAGSYGKDTKGLMRLHQFDKVELVKFVKPGTSYDELEQLLENACKVLELLKLPYRVVALASGDLSFAAAKCYDIEVYSPGIDKWLEVSSCSNFEDFQARRGNIKYKDSKTGKREFVHTLNGSGLALPRLFTAILENYQQEDGGVVIPEVLRGYFCGHERFSR